MTITFDSNDNIQVDRPRFIQDLIDFDENLDDMKRFPNIEWATDEIKYQCYSYIRAGLIAYRVRLYRLYERGKEVFKNFRDYCEQKLGFSNWHVKRLIDAARCALELAYAGFDVLPLNEAQARPLTKFWGEQLIEKWQEVLNSAPKHRITADLVKRVVEGESENPSRRVKIDADDWEKLRERAEEEGTTPEKLLKRLIQGESSEPVENKTQTIDSPHPTPKRGFITRCQMQRWVDDMHQLIAEKFQLVDDPVGDSS